MKEGYCGVPRSSATGNGHRREAVSATQGSVVLRFVLHPACSLNPLEFAFLVKEEKGSRRNGKRQTDRPIDRQGERGQQRKGVRETQRRERERERERWMDLVGVNARWLKAAAM